MGAPNLCFEVLPNCTDSRLKHYIQAIYIIPGCPFSIQLLLEQLLLPYQTMVELLHVIYLLQHFGHLYIKVVNPTKCCYYDPSIISSVFIINIAHI